MSAVGPASFALAAGVVAAVAAAAFLLAAFEIEARLRAALLGTMVAAADGGGFGEEKKAEGDGILISMRVGVVGVLFASL